jgi:hypothetical protein
MQLSWDASPVSSISHAFALQVIDSLPLFPSREIQHTHYTLYLCHSLASLIDKPTASIIKGHQVYSKASVIQMEDRCNFIRSCLLPLLTMFSFSLRFVSNSLPLSSRKLTHLFISMILCSSSFQSRNDALENSPRHNPTTSPPRLRSSRHHQPISKRHERGIKLSH